VRGGGRRSLDAIQGGARRFATKRRRFAIVDAAVVAGLVGLLVSLTRVASEWTGELRPTVAIDLSATALARYTLFSFSRGALAYALSLGFTLIYGYWAAKDRAAERVLVPLLDVLQSIPVLGFMPGLVLALVAVFPTTNVGLELAAVLMIFTGQVWNLTFSFYQSLRSVPPPLREIAELHRFGWWRTLRRVELPSATSGLVYNSMLSVAGGWFFLMINESFVLGNKDFRLPGLGSYMSVAAARGDVPAMLRAMAAMAAMIVVLDQLVFRPLVVWAQKFRVEESASAPMSSWFYDRLRRSHLFPAVARGVRSIWAALPSWPPKIPTDRRAPRAHPEAAHALSTALFAGLLALLIVGAVRLGHLLRAVPAATWIASFEAAGLTLARVLAATALGTLWALPAGLAIGLSPRLSRIFQPIVQVAASFPAPMLFPAVIAVLRFAGVPLGLGSIVLMLLGTQWYILFNVVAGASAVPADLREAARAYRLRPLQRFVRVYTPAVFPGLVTGWITAAGGAWNASIVAEYVPVSGAVLVTNGLGSRISLAAERGDFPALAAAVAVMSLVVVVFNRTVWQACYRLAERRFSLER
jgi:NitT/TauT family transport system permease protein